MSIDRQNILDLIGNYKNRYTSCLITCFTFDFTFFENRVLHILRGSDIKNVNVFLDGKHHDYYLENPLGGEFKTHKAYSLNPIYVAGVFHPKILFLAGPKHGLVIIGSGNITSSGLSTNDEIWGAFHINSFESTNAPVIATVWNYLQQFIRQVNGFNLQKINWMRQYSPWLVDIESLASSDFIPLQDGMDLKFIGNTQAVVAYRDLIASLPKSKIKKLTILSPYFDEQGKILQQLSTDLDIDEIVCITDKEFGILPYRLNDELRNKIPFYDWQSNGSGFNRLHAKVFHFQYQDGWEYLLIGSANATINALGSFTSTARNAEAGLLLRSKGPNNFIEQLGINIQLLQQFELPIEKRKITEIGDNEPISKTKITIPYSEINGSKISIYVLKAFEEKCELVILDEFGDILETHPVEVTENKIQIQVHHYSQVYKIYLTSNNKRISNYCLVHNVAVQAKSNPDPAHNELTQIIETLSADPDQDKFIELLGHVDYNWADEEASPHGNNLLSGGSSEVVKPDKIKEYDRLSEQEFNALQSIQTREIEHLNHPNVYIADLLSAISRGLVISQKSILENPEEALAHQSEDQQTGEGEIVSGINIRTRGELEKNAIYRHMDKVNSFYQNRLNKFHKENIYTTIPDLPLTIKQLSNMSTALDLIYLYQGKSYQVFKTEFVINFDDHKFLTNLTNSFSDMDKESMVKILEKFGIDFTKEKSKSNILTELGKKPRAVLLDYIRYLENRFSLKRTEYKQRIKRNNCKYEINTGWFNDFKKEVNLICPTLLEHLDEYKVITYSKEYFNEGNYTQEDKSGVKKYMYEMLGSFLLNTHSSPEFKFYEYDSVNEKSISLRNIIFDLGTFHCLNMHWNENTSIIRDILLLDLLYFVLPDDEPVISNVTVRIELYSQRCKFKSPFFEVNKGKYLKLLKDYKSWRAKYDHEKEQLVQPKVNALGKIGFNKKLGFFLIRNSGADHILIERPGFKWNENYNGNVLAIRYPQSSIIVF
jgi:hypothetical protein